jgi:hypothetical protein
LSANYDDLGRLPTFGALHDVELDALPLFQIPESFALDLREMDEYVIFALSLDETVALGTVEPLDCAYCSF